MTGRWLVRSARMHPCGLNPNLEETCTNGCHSISDYAKGIVCEALIKEVRTLAGKRGKSSPWTEK